jgi:WD40 repeat protein
MRHAGRVICLAFNHDNSRLATGTDTSVVSIWDVALPQWNAVPDNSLERALSLWSGVESDADGIVRPLKGDDVERRRLSLGDDDPIRRYTNGRLVGSNLRFHRHALANAERAGLAAMANLNPS